MKLSRQWLGAVAAALAVSSSAQAVEIIPTFDTSITSAADASEIESTIISATQFYKNFSDPISVNINFRLGETGLGSAQTTFYGFNYSDYLDGLNIQLLAHPENTTFATAVANLPYGNQPDTVLITSANLNALLVPLGLTFPGLVDGAFDGTVTLSDTPGSLVFSGPVGAQQYDAFAVIQHEVDEILGAGGGGSALNAPYGAPGAGVMEALDLDRYNGFHSPSYTLDPLETAYFSYDGGQTIGGYFNQDPAGDYGDFAKTSCAVPQRVQDWFDCGGLPRYGLTRNSSEVAEFEAIGYNLTPTPEPAAWALMIAGFGGVGARLRQRRRAAAA